MAVVPAKLTPVDPLVALGDLVLAYRAGFKVSPTEAEAKILWAGSSHETAKFARMKNNGVAGIKANPGYGGLVAVYKTTERIDGQNVVLEQRFRAYESPRAGFLDWLDLLRRGYPKALAGARAGSVEGYVDGLQKGWGGKLRYFTADPKAYLAGVWRNIRELNTDYVLAWADILAPAPEGEGGNV